ncbi:hypothetical protein B0A55_01870 [Friedmanniomyces simplex]|uniref:Uncharacterized protein n=1 Tax=Friedmanniomyces simplex TaxID=329884 RepID=A0A4U0XYD4_9PEZI|nr:hypothetical protein B0A55_01870 [Friedmanniomyces simplex]
MLWVSSKAARKPTTLVGKEVVFKTISGNERAKNSVENIRAELLGTTCMMLVAENKQAESDGWLLPGATKTNMEEWAEAHGRWGFW